jgi:hypothetical protein
MIGNAEHAATLANAPLSEDEYGDWVGPAPEGFQYLSSGSYRHAFLGPDGVVYKRNVGDWDDDEGGNASEWDRYCNPPVFPEGVRFAMTHLYGEIIAMEYVADKSPILADNVRQSITAIGVWDCYGQNVRTKDGMVVLTDFAM